MIDHTDLISINEKIINIKKALLELENQGDSFPALMRNSKRALASVRMMELNITDIVELHTINSWLENALIWTLQLTSTYSIKFQGR